MRPRHPPPVGMLWLDTGVKPPLLKRWTGSQWETVNDTTEDFRQVEAQLTVMEDNIRTAVTDLSRLETSMLDQGRHDANEGAAGG